MERKSGRKHKLTRKQEDEIRKLIANGASCDTLAVQFGVSAMTIRRIRGFSQKKGNITEDIRALAVNLVLAGQPTDEVAAMIGVHRVTITTWCHKQRLNKG